MASPTARTRRLSDWVGFTVFAVFAAATVSKIPAVGILLAPSLLLELFVALSFLIRDRPRAAATGYRPRISAYGGTFLLLVFLQVAPRYHPEWLEATAAGPLTVVGLLLWLGGSLWTAVAVWHLRLAFSIEAEARRLITSGPYKWARHPIYTGYFAQYFGMWLVFSTVPFAIVLLVWLLLMTDRMHHEEAVLEGAFPDYADYKNRVGLLGPFRLRRAIRAQTNP